MVCKEGGISRAAERLDMAIQTISVQVRELEKSLGQQLLKPAGRSVALTDAGQIAYTRADEIFRLGQSLVGAVQDAATQPMIRLAVGLSDGLSKLAAHALLGPVLDTPNLRLICHEGEFEELQTELALHRLDLVLTGQAAPASATLGLSSERLVSSPVDWYGPARLVGAAETEDFPRSLERLPVLLPTAHAVLRTRIEQWFDEQRLPVRIVGEFEDSALMSVFAARGLGVFPVSRLGADDVGLLSGLRLLGRCDDLCEEIYAISNRRGARHPLVKTIIGDGVRTLP